MAFRKKIDEKSKALKYAVPCVKAVRTVIGICLCMHTSLQLGGWWHKNTSLATSCILYLNQFKIEFFSWKVKEFKSQNNTYGIVPVVGGGV